MMTSSILFTAPTYLFNNFIQDYNFIFIAAILTFVMSIMLRAKLVFLVQLLLFISIIIIDKSAVTMLYIPVLIIQVLLGATVLFRLKKAFDLTYLLVLEKTHQTKRNITRNSRNGTQNSFFR